MEPEFPYNKQPNEPRDDTIQAPPPTPPEPPPGHPPAPPPLSTPTPNKFTCPQCGKVFTTREELTLHMGTVHQSPKKQV